MVSDSAEITSDSGELALRGALAQLPERQRQAVILRHLEGLSNPQIAEVMEIGVEAVESLLARARRTLKQELLDESRDLIDGLAGAHGGES